jgi:RNA recognition motif-containing protein
MNIYVSNLSFNTNSESLKELFSEYGETNSVNIITDKFTGKSRGFGFVEMNDNTAGEKAINELNGTDFEGKRINVNVARPREDKGNDRYDGRTRGGYNRR